jgi:hypothetical protein
MWGRPLKVNLPQGGQERAPSTCRRSQYHYIPQKPVSSPILPYEHQYWHYGEPIQCKYVRVHHRSSLILLFKFLDLWSPSYLKFQGKLHFTEMCNFVCLAVKCPLFAFLTVIVTPRTLKRFPAVLCHLVF